MNTKKIIFTGGSGLLGSEFQKLRQDVSYPSSEEFDVTDYSQMEAYAEQHGCDLVIHAAAFISPPAVDKDPLKALEVNIAGTLNIVKLCMKHSARLIYISTDYVFAGDKGNYAEQDPVYPANKYAWSKLGGECAARMYEKTLIVRTSFGPNRFPHERAFADQWTSREPVSVFATKLTALIDREVTGVMHVGGARKTTLEYALSLEPSRSIGELSIKDVPFFVPVDTSLNCDRYNNLIRTVTDEYKEL